MANNESIYNAVIAGAGGASQERWITTTDSAAYDEFKATIEQVATAVDADIPTDTIGTSKQALMQSICQGVFSGRFPTLDNYADIAAAIVALYTSLEASLFPDAGGTASPIYQQLWLDTTKPVGGDGSIVNPYNAWADAIAPLQASGSPDPWVIFLAQGLNATGIPVPDIGAGGHATAEIKLQGPANASFFGYNNASLNGLEFSAQSNGRLAIEIVDLLVTGMQMTGSVILTGSNSYLSTLTQSGTVTGSSNLINCSVNFISLDSFELRMNGGTIDQVNSIDTGDLNDVDFLGNLDLRWATSLNITNSRFAAGGVLRCSANQQLNLDLTSWGSMIAAGITFPDTFPTMTITPWVPVIGSIIAAGTTAINPGAVQSIDAGEIAPQRAQKSTACIADFGAAANTDFAVVGASIDANRHLIILVKNSALTTQNLTDQNFTVTYLPQITP